MAKKEQEYAKWVGVLPSIDFLWRAVLLTCIFFDGSVGRLGPNG